MRYLRTNTATRVTVGPFLDKTDGITPEVALTVTSEKLTFVVDTGGVPTLVLDAAPTASAGSNDMVHITGDDSGFYDLELAAADVNYVGRAILSLNDVATHCPVFHEFMILPAVVYDSMILGTDLLDVSMTQILGTAVSTPATAGILDVNVKNIDNDAASASGTVTFPNAVLSSLTTDDVGVIDAGTAQSATGTTLVLRAAAAFADSEIVGATIVIVSATTGAGQSRVITGYVGSTDTATVDAWTTTPTGTIVYKIFASAPASATALPAVNVVQVGGATTNVSTMATSIESRLPAALVSGRLDSSLGAIASGVDLSATMKTSVTTAATAATPTAAAVTGNVGGNVVGSVASVTAGVTVTTNNDKTGYGLSATAVQAIWDAATSALTTVGSIGKWILDKLDAAVSSRLASASYTAPPAAGDVWDVTLASHLTAGTTGNALNAAGAAGDPWTTSIPGAYGAGTAGHRLGNIPDVAAGASGGVFIAGTNAATAVSITGNLTGNVSGSVGSVTAGVTVTTNNDKTGYGLSAAAVQAVWDALTSALTTVGSIGKKLADWTIGTAQTGDSFARLGAPAGASVSADIAAAKVDTAAIKAKTDNLPASPAAVGSAMALTSGERTTLSGVVLTTPVTEAYRANGAAPTPAQFMSEVLGHLGESSISGTTKTLKKLDHTTSAETFTLDDATTPSAITRTT